MFLSARCVQVAGSIIRKTCSASTVSMSRWRNSFNYVAVVVLLQAMVADIHDRGTSVLCRVYLQWLYGGLSAAVGRDLRPVAKPVLEKSGQGTITIMPYDQ
jgi:hypothetical protein